MSVIGLNAELNQLEILLISFFKCPVGVVPLGGGWLRGLLFHGWFGLHVELVFESSVQSIFGIIGLKKGTRPGYYFL
jgi:hypothetical protein